MFILLEPVLKGHFKLHDKRPRKAGDLIESILPQNGQVYTKNYCLKMWPLVSVTYILVV